MRERERTRTLVHTCTHAYAHTHTLTQWVAAASVAPEASAFAEIAVWDAHSEQLVAVLQYHPIAVEVRFVLCFSAHLLKLQYGMRTQSS